MRIGITTSATFKSKTYVAGATKANMSGAITGDTPEAFVEALHDVNDNHAKDDIESALDYISDAKREFVKELKYQLSNLEYLEPERPRYFKETPPRKLTKEEESQTLKTLILLCVVGLVFAFLVCTSYNDTLFNLSQITRVIRHSH